MKKILLMTAYLVLLQLNTCGIAIAATVLPAVNPEIQLDVNYTSGSIISGPMSFGLTTLPSNVNATFLLGSGNVGVSGITYGISDVFSGQVSFGDAHWSLLDSFSMLVSNGNVTSLSYSFLPGTSDSITAPGPIILNFPLTITGTDFASGDAFEYRFTSSTQSISTIPEPGTILLLATGIIYFARTQSRKKAL